VGSRKKRILLYGLGAVVLGAGVLASQLVCLSGYLRYGIWVHSCPAGDPQVGVQINAYGLRRGSKGQISLAAPVFYTTGPADQVRIARSHRFDGEVSLVRGEQVTPLTPVEGWSDEGERRVGQFILPKDLEDGDYQLRAQLDTALGEVEHQIPLPIYAPARIHTLSDRPLYEPGNTIRFRAVVLRARDLSPLDRRPGRFKVSDPTGEVVMETLAPAGAFGVAHGDFPLDEAATTGDWRITYESGDASDSITVRVEPFTLPRFVVEAAPAAAFYGVGDAPVVRGQVRYSSGAPVSGAHLSITWSHSGAWPPPSRWMRGALPTDVYAEQDGRFELRLPRVPGDLLGQARLTAQIRAQDAAKDEATARVQVLLSKDDIAVSAVTELDGGLVEGFNNRVYLRVTTAAGQPLPNTDIVVRRAWDPGDEGRAARTDVDGVAALQFDPGPAVNVLIPAPPVRPPPRPVTVRRHQARELASPSGISLADQVRLDQQQGRLAPCARFVADGSEQVAVSLKVSPSGRVQAVTHEALPTARCVASIARDFVLAPGAARIFELTWVLTEDLPSLELSFEGTPVVPDGVQQALQTAALDARRCLPESTPRGAFDELVMWQAEPGQRGLSISWSKVVGARTRISATARRCIKASLASTTLAEVYPKHAQRAFGVARLRLSPGPRYETSEPEDRMRLGYELAVSARSGTEDLGKTKVFLAPGQVPAIRLRATPVLAEAGQEVQIKVLRGPDFRGELPEKLYWRHEGTAHEMPLNKDTRTASFTIPKDSSGWFEVKWHSGRALVFVRSAQELAVELTPDKTIYAPGAQAKLRIKTSAGGIGTSAAVGLFGVDQTLSQLAPLAGPDALSRLRSHPTMRSSAFGVLDAQALSQARIRGPAAAAATVIRVSSIPAPEDFDRFTSADGRSSFDPIEGLTDNFYRALGALYAEVRTWEGSAPKDEIMRPATMARLWQAALTAVEKQGEPVKDAYGRRLRLSVLPNDLLALADPRSVVVDGTRLSEDVENWIDWVRKEQP